MLRGTLARSASRWWHSRSVCAHISSSSRFSLRQISGSAADAPTPRLPPGTRVVVGMSGGVDSSVAALLLRAQGADVQGLFMRNWDESEETGTGTSHCSTEQDRQDAREVCRRLSIPLHEVDLVAQYWQQVFEPFLCGWEQGLSPNPDLDCNRFIKFGAFHQHAVAQLGAEVVATGHYARVRASPGGGVQLLRGVDPEKDQSYFLATVRQAALQQWAFPLGGLKKERVRELAREAGLHCADRRSSRGICFIGKRSFPDFLSQYMAPFSGSFVSVESGAVIGECSNIAAVTSGQSARISGAPERFFVVGKDIDRRVVYVAPGTLHPALMCRSAVLRQPVWLSGVAPWDEGRDMRDLVCKPWYRSDDIGCEVFPGTGGAAVSAYSAVTDREDGAAVVQFAVPVRGIAPQQAVVLYDGEQCLGGALVLAPGVTLHEEGQRQKNMIL